MDVKQTRGMAITADFLEAFSYMSDNPIFQTEQFRRALADFREYGYATPNKQEFDLDYELRLIKDRLRGVKRLER